VETKLGRFPAETELPEPLKFAWPVVVLPELFTTASHLAMLVGYFATTGWEVFAPDLNSAIGHGDTPALEKLTFQNLVDLASEALDGLGREAIVVGHGIGGLVALKLAEHRGVKAAVAMAPLMPGFRTPLFMRIGNWLPIRQGRPLNPPSGRKLFEFVADADPFTREQTIKTLIPGATAAAMQVVRGDISFATGDSSAPRLIVAGESDIFATYEKQVEFARRIGAAIVQISGRGHWLIGGRALERSINEIQRFLVKSLGRDLLLLYPEEWKREE
jgi:pimeloyl-ACP methyl ester carboxylesterase